MSWIETQSLIYITFYFEKSCQQTNKQTNRQSKKIVHTEVRTLDPCFFSTMLLPTEIEGLTHLITFIKLLLSDYYYQINKKVLAAQRFELSILAFLAQCSYRLSYRAVLI